MVRKWIPLMLALFCLVGCTPVEQEPEQSEGEYGIWFAVDEVREGASHSAVVEFEPRPWKELPSAQTMLENLFDSPINPDLVSPFPAGVKVLDLNLDTEFGTMYVNLSEQYGSLSGFDLTVADYCIVMTLCQIPWVSNVRILVEGEPIPYRNRQNMRDTDLLLSGIGDQPETFMAVLYFPDRDNLGLSAEYRQVKRSSDNAAEIVMTELLRGPMGIDANRALPEGTQILGLSISGTVCQVDLSAEFVDNAPQNGLGPSTTLYALVNTLCAQGGISQVRILVEGTPLQSYHGTAISNPASVNFDIVKEK